MTTLRDILLIIDIHTPVYISLGYGYGCLDEGKVYDIVADLDDNMLDRKVHYMELQTLYKTSETNISGSRLNITNKVESRLYILLEPDKITNNIEGQLHTLLEPDKEER